MQVSVETIGTLGRRLKVAVPADQVEKEFHARLLRLSKQAKMPGFRPGKVPLKMLEVQYGGRLMDEIAGELIQSTLPQAMGSQGLRAAGDPRIQRKPMTRGEQLEYTAEFEIFPEVTRFDLATKSVEKPVVVVTEDDVNRTLETIRKQRATWKQAHHEAQLGDRLTIDFVGRIDGAEFEGGKANGFQVVLGTATLIEDMEQGLVGARQGEMRRISAKFPSNYRHAPLAGKTADFDVQVTDVAQAVLPELNESFARELGVADGSLDKLRAEVKSNLEREAANRIGAVVRARVLKQLLDVNPIEVPQSLLDVEIQRLKKSDMSSGFDNAEPMVYEKRARSRVALGLILAEIIRNRGIVPDPAKVRARIEEMAVDYESPQEFIQWHYANPDRLREIETLVLEEKIVEDMLASAQVSEKPMSFQELLKVETSL